MTQTALSETVMLDGLRDIRLPAGTPEAVLADVVTGLGLGGLAAVMVLLILRGLANLRPSPRPPSLRMQKQAALAMEPAARRVALLRLLRDHAPERFAALTPQIYQQGAVPDDTLIAEVRDIG